MLGIHKKLFTALIELYTKEELKTQTYLHSLQLVTMIQLGKK
jgi:hypothetical protein